MRNDYLRLTGAQAASRVDLRKAPHNSHWDVGMERELKMHRIHAYPAKFPAFITTKALEYAAEGGAKVRRVADIFCGCGTVALEAKRGELTFWGCDINPVATLIARTKSHTYQVGRLERYAEAILAAYKKSTSKTDLSDTAKKRLEYWFDKEQFRHLARLKNAITAATRQNSKYQDFFFCAFSNILKPTSRWLTKSIKPQLDPNKSPAAVVDSFRDQVTFMIAAYRESPVVSSSDTATIINANFLATPLENIGEVDMVVTSPPYVTSYEYADLHQLSSLWLGYVDDYRDLRNGSIGSTQHDYNFNRDIKRLNDSGSTIVFRLYNEDPYAARSVAKYYLDMQEVAARCAKVIRRGGLGVFVIGNTQYKSIPVDNARHLVESLLSCGFKEVDVAKRRISNKILTPYRDAVGRFSRSANGRQVYGDEYVVIAKR